MKRRISKPWLKALSGLSINLSAGWFGVALIGPNISFPNSFWDFAVLLSNLGFGIMFLLITVYLEKGVRR